MVSSRFMMMRLGCFLVIPSDMGGTVHLPCQQCHGNRGIHP